MLFDHLLILNKIYATLTLCLLSIGNFFFGISCPPEGINGIVKTHKIALSTSTKFQMTMVIYVNFAKQKQSLIIAYYNSPCSRTVSLVLPCEFMTPMGVINTVYIARIWALFVPTSVLLMWQFMVGEICLNSSSSTPSHALVLIKRNCYGRDRRSAKDEFVVVDIVDLTSRDDV